MNVRFRVFDEGVMYYPEEEHTLFPNYVIGPRGSVWQPVRDGLCELPCPPMLSTGFKDKDEREIWDGDIIKVITLKDEPEEFTTIQYVEWVKEFGGWMTNRLNKLWWLMDTNDVEVIGNRYESPELLEK